MNSGPMEHDQITLRDIQAFVGPNANRYFLKWSAMIEKAGSLEKAAGKPSWNWAAFLFTVGWLFYRKMYGLAAAVVLVFVMTDVLSSTTTIDLTRYVVLAVPLTLGFAGDGLYLRHFQKKTSPARELTNDDETLNLTLKGIGGTSPVAGLAGAIGVIGISFAIEYGVTGTVPFYQSELVDRSIDQNVIVNDAAAQQTKLLPVGLQDLTGIWATEHGQTLTVVMDGLGSSIIVDDVQFPISITETFGDDFDMVQFQPGSDPGPNDYWAFFKNWNEAHTEFTLRFVDNIGGANELGYVRELTPVEVRELQGQLKTLQPNPSARLYDVVIMTRPDQPMGTQRTFNFLADGYDGQLVMTYLSGRRNAFVLNTINTSRFHTCDIEFFGDGSDASLYRSDMPEVDCTVIVKIGGELAEVLSNGGACRDYCGLGGWFDGLYVEAIED